METQEPANGYQAEEGGFLGCKGWKFGSKYLGMGGEEKDFRLAIRTFWQTFRLLRKWKHALAQAVFSQQG